MKKSCLKSGFTLIELLVVVLIIGILSAVALPQYRKAVYKSRFVSMIPTVDTLAQAERSYYLAQGVYATPFSLLDITIPKTKNMTFNLWFSTGQRSGIVFTIYRNIQYLRDVVGKGERECRAHKDDAVAVAVCESYGEYVATYGDFKAYSM